jgi:hypothetical protein
MSYAAPNRRVVGDRRVQKYLDRQERKGNDRPDVREFLARKLGKGSGLSAKVVNSLNSGKYPQGFSFANPSGAANVKVADDKFGKGTAADVAGLSGLRLDPGDVYMGATEVEQPGTQTRSKLTDFGVSQTPGSTTMARTILPRWMVKGAGKETAAPADRDDTPKAPVEPGADLLAARGAYEEAYNRANSYRDQSSANSGGSFASGGADLSLTGGDLLNSIQSAGNAERSDYEQRFLPQVIAGANLTAQEIGYGAKQAISNLPSDLKLPDYSKIFPDRAEKKGGLHKWLESRIA